MSHKQKKNILLWGFGKTAGNLHKHLDENIEIKVWIDRARHKTTTHSMEDFEHHLAVKNQKLKIDYSFRKEYPDIYRKLKKDILKFLYIYSRYPTFNGENNFQDMMDAFHIYIHFFIDLLKRENIHCAVFSLIPHHSDYILYRVAQELGIQTLVFETYGIVIDSYSEAKTRNRQFLMTNIDQVGTLATDDKTLQPLKVLSNPRSSYFSSEISSPFVKKLKAKQRHINRIISALIFRRDLNLFFYRLMAMRKDYQFRKCYNRYAEKHIPTGKFVYFALHFQPELTTSVLGDEFVDQIIALEYLRALLPDDWVIAVKENPHSTFHSRSILFFERLRRIPNTVYLAKEVNTFDLIEKCEFLATITGTAGLEALGFKKNVLIFGDAIYKNFPGVISYREDLHLQDITDVHFTHKELGLAYAQLASTLEEEPVAPFFAAIANDPIDYEDNGHKIASMLNRFMQKI